MDYQGITTAAKWHFQYSSTCSQRWWWWPQWRNYSINSGILVVLTVIVTVAVIIGLLVHRSKTSSKFTINTGYWYGDTNYISENTAVSNSYVTKQKLQMSNNPQEMMSSEPELYKGEIRLRNTSLIIISFVRLRLNLWLISKWTMTNYNINAISLTYNVYVCVYSTYVDSVNLQDFTA